MSHFIEDVILCLHELLGSHIVWLVLSELQGYRTGIADVWFASLAFLRGDEDNAARRLATID